MKYMKRKGVFVGALAVLILAFAVLAFAQQSGYFQFNGKSFTVKSGGTQTVASGGIVNFASGSYLKLNSTSVTATAAEINKLAGVTAGTTTASKALVVGGDKGLTELYVASLTHKQPVYIVQGDTTITATQSGTLFVARPLAAKKTVTLPGAAAGITYDIMVADGDSLLITTASGDSLITSAGEAWKTTTSVAGTVKLTAYDATRWLMVFTLGTWTSY